MARENTWHGYNNGQKQAHLHHQHSEVSNSRGGKAMTSNEARPPTAFISYSHDSPEHADRVLALSDHLRADGIDCILDQYEDAPPEGFPRWIDRQIRAADFVVMICTPTYYRRVMGAEEPGKGHGVAWQGVKHYRPTTTDGYEELYRRLTGQLLTPKPALGTLRTLPPRQRTHDFVERVPGERPLEVIENVPYSRNPYFTGRDTVLQNL